MTKGQIEDTITKQIVEFYMTTLKSGPREAKTYLIEDMVIVRLKGNLLPIEEQLLEGTNGVELVKNVRKALHEINIKRLSSIIEKITGHKVISTHGDISTKTGERFEAFILDSDYEKELHRTQ